VQSVSGITFIRYAHVKRLVLFVKDEQFYISHEIFSWHFGHCDVCLSLIYGFWLPLWYLQTLLIIFFYPFSFGHCDVCSSSNYGFWLLLWYLQTLLMIFFCPFFLWPLWILFFELRIRFTPLVSSNFSMAYEEFQDTKGVIRIRKSKNRHHYG
jgi:hypothetical protein